MKSVRYTEQVERYFDCPYCDELISDNGTAGNVDTILSGDVVVCPKCGKEIRVTGGN